MQIINGSRPMLLKDQSDPHLDDERHAVDMDLARQMSEILGTQYPGHMWATHADSRTGTMWIAIPALMGPSLRFRLRGERMTSYPEMCAELREAGGHILERLKLPRGAFDLVSFLEARKKAITRHDQPMPE